MLLNKDQIAERLSTTPDIARRVLSAHGVQPVDLGPGRGRGKRWYSSAVDAVIHRMHEEAQEKNPQKRRVHVGPHLVRGKTVKQLYAELTQVTPSQ